MSEGQRLYSLLEKLSLIDLHFVRKENQLFPILESKGISGPTKVMWAIHDDIRNSLKDIRQKVSDGRAKKDDIKPLFRMIYDMIYKEEQILFPLSLETLSEQDWAKVREGEEEIGYAWIRPEAEWRPSEMPLQQELL